MKPLPTVLLVDDDEEVVKSLLFSLSRKKLTVHCAFDGEEALKFMETQPVDVVVSDIQMPKMNGVDLLKAIKAKDPKQFVILTTGFANILETKTAAELGADAFLPKPFNGTQLFEKIIELVQPPRVSSENPASALLSYQGICIDEFVNGSHISYPIFLKLGAERFVQIAHEGSDLDLARIERFKKSGVDRFYLKTADYEVYVSTIKTVKNRLLGAKPPAGGNNLARATLVGRLTKTIAEMVLVKAFDSQVFQEARENILSTVEFGIAEDQTLALFESIATHSLTLHAHSVGVAVLATMMMKPLGWSNDRTLQNLVLGGFLHDIGKKLLPIELIEKPITEMTASDRKEYERHPTLGLEILERLPQISEDVRSIVLQHHEDCVGTGFPQKLDRTSIHPLAKVITVCDQFLHAFSALPPDLGLKNRCEIPLKNMVRHRTDFFDRPTMEALKKIFV